MTRRPLVVLAPIAPARTGNGLAMRVRLLAEAAGLHHDVHLVVIPVAGRQPAEPWFGASTVSFVDPVEPGPGALVPWVSDPQWRTRFEGLVPIPVPVLAAPPSLAADVAARLPTAGMAAVLALRLSLGPLGLALAEKLQVPLILDADDDDADYWRQSGQPDEASAWVRVAQLCLPASSLVVAASAPVASALTRRHNLVDPVRVVPNAVIVPDRVARPETTSGPDRARLLVVANFTYRPNIAGADWLVREVIPLLGARWHVDLVGATGPSVQALASDRVTVHGWVPDVEAYYAAATAAAVPVLSGSGTRIKLLEAMAQGCPVVTTSVGAAGLLIEPGVHALVADDPRLFADAVRAASDPVSARRLVQAASTLVRAQYDATAVATAAAALLADVTDQ